VNKTTRFATSECSAPGEVPNSPFDGNVITDADLIVVGFRKGYFIGPGNHYLPGNQYPHEVCEVTVQRGQTVKIREQIIRMDSEGTTKSNLRVGGYNKSDLEDGDVIVSINGITDAEKIKRQFLTDCRDDSDPTRTDLKTWSLKPGVKVVVQRTHEVTFSLKDERNREIGVTKFSVHSDIMKMTFQARKGTSKLRPTKKYKIEVTGGEHLGKTTVFYVRNGITLSVNAA